MSLSRTSLRLAFLFTFGLSQIVTLTESAIAQNVTPANTTLPTTLQVAQANVIIFVSPNGSDANSGFSADQPLRSLTAALNKNLQSGAIIQLAAGTYSAETGEKFPLIIPAGVSLYLQQVVLVLKALPSPIRIPEAMLFGWNLPKTSPLLTIRLLILLMTVCSSQAQLPQISATTFLLKMGLMDSPHLGQAQG